MQRQPLLLLESDPRARHEREFMLRGGDPYAQAQAAREMARTGVTMAQDRVFKVFKRVLDRLFALRNTIEDERGKRGNRPLSMFLNIIQTRIGGLDDIMDNIVAFQPRIGTKFSAPKKIRRLKRQAKLLRGLAKEMEDAARKGTQAYSAREKRDSARKITHGFVRELRSISLAIDKGVEGIR